MTTLRDMLLDKASPQEVLARAVALAADDEVLLVAFVRSVASQMGCTFAEDNLALLNRAGVKALATVIKDLAIGLDVIGGLETEPGEFPYCVALLKGRQSPEVVGSGILVSRNLVLTAGHCLTKAVSHIWVGTDVGNEGERYQVVKGSLCKYFGYKGQGEYAPVRNDIGCLRVAGAEAIGDRVPIATKEEVERAEAGWLVGFGSNQESGGTGTGRQRIAEIPVIKEQVIGSKGTKLAMNEETELLAGTPLCVENPKDACGDDSGAPFFIKVNERFKLAALTSRRADRTSSPCGSGAIYTRVHPYEKHWLKVLLDSDGKICPRGSAFGADRSSTMRTF